MAHSFGGRAIRWSLVVASVLVTCAVGYLAGSAITTHRTKVADAENNRDLENDLNKTLKGIVPGGTFPNIVVQASNSSAATNLYSILPHGGTIAYISSHCPACTESATAIAAEWKRKGRQSSPLVILVNGEGEAISRALANRKIKVPIFLDIEEALLRRYGVTVTPVCFFLDANNGLVTSKVVSTDTDDISDLL